MYTFKTDIYNKLFLYFFLLLWVCLVHYYQQFGGGGGLFAPFNSTTWIGVSLIIGLTFYKIATTRKFYWDMQDIILAGLGISLAVPLLWSDPFYTQSTYDRYFAVFVFIVFVALLKQFTLTKSQSEVLYLIIIISGVIESLLSIFQYLSPAELDLYLFGFSITPAYGIFQQPNLVGTFIASTVALSFYLQITNRTLSSRWRLFLQITLAVSVSTIILTGSRTATLATAFSLLGLTWVLTSKENIRELIKLWGIVVIAGILLAFLWPWLNALINNIDQGIIPSDPFNVSSRFETYKLTLAMILEHPFSGWGPGSYQSIFMERLVSGETGSILETSSTWSHPHNEILFLAFEGGILPVITTILGVLVITITSWNGSQKSRAFLWIAFPIIFHTMTEFPLYESVPHLILLAIILAETNTFRRHSLKVQIYKASLILAFIIPIIVVPFMLTNLHTTYIFTQFWRAGMRNPAPLTKVINIWGQEEMLNVYTVMSIPLWSDNQTQTDRDEMIASYKLMAQYEMALRPSKSNYINLMNVLDKARDYEGIKKTRNIWNKNWKLQQDKKDKADIE